MAFELLAVVLIAIVCEIYMYFAARERREITAKDELSVEPHSAFLAVSVAQAFDPDDAIIWETQVPILQSVDAAGDKGVPALVLYDFYCRSAKLYPELYDGCDFRSWLDFLEREELICAIGARIFITKEGHEFLKYRVIPQTEHVARTAA